jgi:hypothetical protein
VETIDSSRPPQVVFEELMKYVKDFLDC